jgi:8-oxo-dGTP pyrophosphatase MutT (NUDIX family)
MPTPRPITVADVETVCRGLPEPGWQRILESHPSPRPAATLIPVVDLEGAAAVVVTRRAGSLSHGGDWVFPGGLVDGRDRSHSDAALRETSEELGVAPERIRVIGQLDRHGPIVTGHVIETYVGVIDGPPEFEPDAHEVSEVAIVSVDDLLLPGRTRRGPVADAERASRIETAPGVFRPTLDDLLHYEIRPGAELWGLQANMLMELLQHLTAGAHRA